MGGWRANQLHQLEEDPPSIQDERGQKVRPGVEEGKVADQGLQGWQRSSLHVFCQDLTFVPLCSDELWEEGLILRMFKLQ